MVNNELATLRAELIRILQAEMTLRARLIRIEEAAMKRSLTRMARR
jgi:hypothetical protein